MPLVTDSLKRNRVLRTYVHQYLNEIRIKPLVYLLDSPLNRFKIFFLLTFLKNKKIQDQHDQEENNTGHDDQAAEGELHVG